MFKKMIIALLLVLSLCLLPACNKKGKQAKTNTTLQIEDYMASLSSEKTAHLQPQINLLLHPLKDAIAQYGDDYELSWKRSYVTLNFPEAKCAFEAYVGAAFEHYDWYNNYIDFDDCNVMEYLSFAVIERVVFDSQDLLLTDGISIGMSATEISQKLKVKGLAYYNESVTITTEYDDSGNKAEVYSIYGRLSDVDYILVFKGDVLSRVDILRPSSYLTGENKETGNGKQLIDDAFSFVSEHALAAFDADDLIYQGKIYSPYYDSWFDSWEFTRGDYAGYKIHVEQAAPYRIYVASSANSLPILFWCDGSYVDPMLSFLGKWRDYNNNHYIHIHSISKEGIVVFDMYTTVGDTGQMVLLENLSTAINQIPQTLDAYLQAEYAGESLSGDMQIFDGNVQSGAFASGDDKYYLLDSLLMDLSGSVEYLPRGLGSRVGSGLLPIHIPDKHYDYAQNSTWGYMENFGRDDPNSDNRISANTPAGHSLLDRYLNKLYETAGLQYAELEYRYLYDYVFPVNNATYHVWESKDTESPHYLYVDSANELIIKECQLHPVARHTKDLIYKSNVIVGSRSYAEQTFVALDGNITVDLVNRTITKTGTIVQNTALPEIGLDAVGENERFMFFVGIGNRFALNGYVLFDHTTWGATLHITDSNVPDFPIGVYYLNSETFFLDPTIGVVGVPKDTESDAYIDDKLDEIGQETKLVIRKSTGQIIGYIYVDEQGKKTVKDYGGKILGYYYPDRDVTTDFGGKIVARGDISSALLFMDP